MGILIIFPLFLIFFSSLFSSLFSYPFSSFVFLYFSHLFVHLHLYSWLYFQFLFLLVDSLQKIHFENFHYYVHEIYDESPPLPLIVCSVLLQQYLFVLEFLRFVDSFLYYSHPFSVVPIVQHVPFLFLVLFVDVVVVESLVFPINVLFHLIPFPKAEVVPIPFLLVVVPIPFFLVVVPIPFLLVVVPIPFVLVVVLFHVEFPIYLIVQVLPFPLASFFLLLLLFLLLLFRFLQRYPPFLRFLRFLPFLPSHFPHSFVLPLFLLTLLPLHYNSLVIHPLPRHFQIYQILKLLMVPQVEN